MSEQSQPNAIEHIKILKSSVLDIPSDQNNSPLINNYRLLPHRLLTFLKLKGILPLKWIRVFEGSKSCVQYAR